MKKFEWMGDYHLSKDANALNRKHAEFITGEDEMLWLRETYLPNLDDAFVSAILYGNENHPEGFEVFRSEDREGPSEIYVRNYKPEESVMTDAKKLVEMVLSESSDFDTWEVKHALDQKWVAPGEILEVVSDFLKSRSFKKESEFHQASEDLQALIRKHSKTLFPF